MAFSLKFKNRAAFVRSAALPPAIDALKPKGALPAAACILALDLASVTGVAIGRPGERPILSTVELRRDRSDNDYAIFAYAAGWIDRLLGEAAPDVVALERVPPLHDKSLQLGLRGIVIGRAKRQGIQVLEAAIPEWRAYALGTSRLRGAEAKARSVELVRRLGWGEVGHDAAEAAMIFLWACNAVAPQRAQRHEPLFLSPFAGAQTAKPNVGGKTPWTLNKQQLLKVC